MKSHEHRVSAKARALARSETTSQQLIKADVWRPTKPGTVLIDVLEYPVGRGNLMADEGFWHFEFTYWVHRIPYNNKLMICPARMKRGRCFVCEYIQKALGDGKPFDDMRPLFAKERQLFQVLVNKQPDIVVMDMSYHVFGAKLDARAKNLDDDDPRQYFASLENGYSLKVLFEEQSFGQGRSVMSAVDIDFVQRKSLASYRDKLLVLEKLIEVPSYEELREALFPFVAEYEKSQPSAKHQESESEAAPAKARSKTSREVEPETEESEEPEPAPPKIEKSSPTRKAEKPVDEDEELDSLFGTEEEEVKGPQPSKKKAAQEKLAKLVPEDEEEEVKGPQPSKKKAKAEPKEEDDVDWDSLFGDES